MPKLGEVAQKVRSKNAGPFWVTIDIFCGTEAAFRRVESGLSTEAVAKVRHILEELSLEIATPSEARATLALKGGDRVAF